MILVYSLLEENRDRLILQLVAELREASRVYLRIPRAELKESMGALFDAYLEFLISRKKNKLSITLNYLVRLRMSQSLGLVSIVRMVLCFIPVFRAFLQNKENDYKAITYLEEPIFEMLDLVIEIFEKQQKEPHIAKRVNFSRLLIYRG